MKTNEGRTIFRELQHHIFEEHLGNIERVVEDFNDKSYVDGDVRGVEDEDGEGQPWRSGLLHFLNSCLFISAETKQSS